MNTDALITAARHYLKNNFAYWADRYSKERTGADIPYSYTDNDYNLFPRYNVITAILDGVEALTGNTVMTVAECKAALIEIGTSANSSFTTGEQNAIELQAMAEERDKFVDYIVYLDSEIIVKQEPLPYRRRLTKEESEKVRKALKNHWGFQGDYWDPLEKLSPQPTVFLSKEYITDKDYLQIISTIKKLASDRLYEVVEDGRDAEIEFSSFHPDCYETIYCDGTWQWIVYGSHEGTVTFGGESLIYFVNNLFANREDKLNYW